MTEADSTPQHNSVAQPGRGPLIERIIDASARNKFLVFIFKHLERCYGVYALASQALEFLLEPFIGLF